MLFKISLLIAVFFTFLFVSYGMDTLIIVFDKSHFKQKVFENIYYSKGGSPIDKVPIYKSRVFKLFNDRKVIGSRIVDTISFGCFVVLDKQLFDAGERRKIFLDLKELQKELDDIPDKHSEAALEILKKIDIM